MSDVASVARAGSVARCLLQGSFRSVGTMRDHAPDQFAALPEEIRQVANRFIGQGRVDRPGKDALKAYLDEHFPRPGG